MNPADLARVLDIFAQVAPWRLPLVRAAAAGKIAVAEPGRIATGKAVRSMLNRPGLPEVVLIGDDDYRSTGPAGWRCADWLAGWGRRALIHGAGGEGRHYEVAVQAAVAGRRLALVETTSAHAAAWAALLRDRMPSLIVVPKPGDGPHPIPPVRH
ncbi:MAG: hypothetical protein ABS99_05720 [Acetobacteraceae bacterium SCN 69-10]|nr:hypothetical protein [Rhodospirillales bacterium]ODU56593.1 MAG: hypothetical protein ABS99_05720 [Acetobacteraceae bacterium SCN 69-10]OJY67266.1 MAG: hypothetical protein BGP12_14055 [Rhodospirillales bacterium 70-18]